MEQPNNQNTYLNQISKIQHISIDQLKQLSNTDSSGFQECLNKLAPIKQPHSMSQAQYLAIIVYTYPLQIIYKGRCLPLYRQINNFMGDLTLSTFYQTFCNDWRAQYCALFTLALNHLPSLIQPVKTYRGVRDMVFDWTVGQIVSFPEFQSTSIKMNIAYNFMKGATKGSFLTIQTKTGKDISKQSFYQTQQQIILLPYSSFKVISVRNNSQIRQFELKEIS